MKGFKRRSDLDRAICLRDGYSDFLWENENTIIRKFTYSEFLQSEVDKYDAEIKRLEGKIK